ncbi:pectin lyase fold/virulence factor [Tricladium varicosporioides]|nr:pectin lyase fold/virulence factor [Hymenoscyphus varicosporioides]
MFSQGFAGFLSSALFLSSQVYGQAVVDTTKTGPSTALSAKSTICNVLNYGAVADNSTDLGPAITKAFSSCASGGGATIYIPPGTYSLQTGVTLNKGGSYAIQIDGLIILTSDGSFGGNAIVIENTSDVEVFSSNGLGAINGQGYITRASGGSQNARLLRFISSSEISIHDIIFVDSPTFHLVFNDVSNMEAYHITVRGPNKGGTDAIDVICTDNCYMHDIEATGRDECISVKSPSQNILIEDIFCNQSGGMSIGSLTADITDTSNAAAVSNITMRNIYIHQCTQMLMIKTFPGGTGATGYVKNSLFENFWAYDTTYGLDIDQYWESHSTPNTGAVALSSLTFNNWTGTVDNGVSRAPIVIRGSDIVPLTDITLTNIDMWTVNGGKILNQCKNVYGAGYCVGTSTGTPLATFTTTATTTSAPAAFTSPTSPAWGLGTTGYGLTIPIPIYTPAVFWSVASAGVASGTAAGSSAATTSASSAVQTSKASSRTSATSKVASSTKKVVNAVATSSSISPSSISAAAGEATSIPSSVEIATSSIPEYSPSSGILATATAIEILASSSTAEIETSTIPEFSPSSVIASSAPKATPASSSSSAEPEITTSTVPEFSPTPVSPGITSVIPTEVPSTTFATKSRGAAHSGVPSKQNGGRPGSNYNKDDWECERE